MLVRISHQPGGSLHQPVTLWGGGGMESFFPNRLIPRDGMATLAGAIRVTNHQLTQTAFPW